MSSRAKLRELVELMLPVLKDPQVCAAVASGLELRSYQVGPARAIVRSVIEQRGDSIVVMFPRQSGKNELQAQIETFLLLLLSVRDAELVKVSPTWKPQSLNAMRRLERVLDRNLLTRRIWNKESGYIYRVRKARIFFLSGAPEANIVGATANYLLEVDEAQDVQASKFDKDVLPMAASTNATRVFWGTAWTSQTLLAREKRAAEAAERRDGVRRVFHITADDVGAEVPSYKKFVADQIAKLGRGHPLVKTQFFSEEIDAETGMFPAGRLALMAGAHAPRSTPEAGRMYALLLDVAGEDEAATEDLAAISGSRRDSTALTIVEVDLSTVQDEAIKAPTYRVLQRREWVGKKHTALYGEIVALAKLWHAEFVVVDATGIGAGLASFLDRALPGRVLPFVFTSASKSDLGWQFLATIETGRYLEYKARAGSPEDALQARFYDQCAHCESSILDGPGHRMRWGVPDGRRSIETGELVHDDLVLSAALVAVLDDQEWSVKFDTLVIPARDPLEELDSGF